MEMTLDTIHATRSTTNHRWAARIITGIPVLFLAFDVAAIAGRDEGTRVVEAILADLRVRYPGERAFDARRQNLKDGIPVEPSAWRTLETAAAS